MTQRHFDKIPEQHGQSRYGGRTGKPSGMGKYKKGDLVVVDTVHGPTKGRYRGYSTDSFSHDVDVLGPHGRSAATGERVWGTTSIAGEEEHKIRPNTDPADIEHEERWQGYLRSQWRDRRA